MSRHPIPPELDALVLACLAKDPAARPASAAILSDALAAIPLPAPWTPARAHAWWIEHVPQLATRPSIHGDPAQEEGDAT